MAFGLTGVYVLSFISRTMHNFSTGFPSTILALYTKKACLQKGMLCLDCTIFKNENLLLLM